MWPSARRAWMLRTVFEQPAIFASSGSVGRSERCARTCMIARETNGSEMACASVDVRVITESWRVMWTRFTDWRESSLSIASPTAWPRAWSLTGIDDIAGTVISHSSSSLSTPRTATSSGTRSPVEAAVAMTCCARRSCTQKTAVGRESDFSQRARRCASSAKSFCSSGGGEG